MAAYDYKCEAHGVMEVHHPISSPQLERCPKDGCDRPVTRLIGPTSFALQGGGWYKDGYSSGRR